MTVMERKNRCIEKILANHENAYAHFDDINSVYSAHLKKVVPMGIAMLALRDELEDEPVELLECISYSFLYHG